MKIGNNPDLASATVGSEKPATAQTGRSPANGAAAPVAAKPAPQASATIELSSAAAKLLSGVPDDGSFDAAKVSRISQAITDGKFTINAEAIADKLIFNAKEVLGRRSPH